MTADYTFREQEARWDRIFDLGGGPTALRSHTRMPDELMLQSNSFNALTERKRVLGPEHLDTLDTGMHSPMHTAPKYVLKSPTCATAHDLQTTNAASEQRIRNRPCRTAPVGAPIFLYRCMISGFKCRREFAS
jgi:hypothetical protein